MKSISIATFALIAAAGFAFADDSTGTDVERGKAFNPSRGGVPGDTLKREIKPLAAKHDSIMDRFHRRKDSLHVSHAAEREALQAEWKAAETDSARAAVKEKRAAMHKSQKAERRALQNSKNDEIKGLKAERAQTRKEKADRAERKAERKQNRLEKAGDSVEKSKGGKAE